MTLYSSTAGAAKQRPCDSFVEPLRWRSLVVDDPAQAASLSGSVQFCRMSQCASGSAMSSQAQLISPNRRPSSEYSAARNKLKSCAFIVLAVPTEAALRTRVSKRELIL